MTFFRTSGDRSGPQLCKEGDTIGPSAKFRWAGQRSRQPTWLIRVDFQVQVCHTGGREEKLARQVDRDIPYRGLPADGSRTLILSAAAALLPLTRSTTSALRPKQADAKQTVTVPRCHWLAGAGPGRLTAMVVPWPGPAARRPGQGRAGPGTDLRRASRSLHRTIQ